MAVNLHEKYEKKIKSAFVSESFVAGRLCTDYDFTGVRTVKVSTPRTVPMTDYDRASSSNRYGIPEEMQDTVQELILSQDKSFALTIDKGNNADQNGIKSAGRMLALQIREQAVPLMDSYVFSRLARLAGSIVGEASPLTKNNICERISDAGEVLDNAEVPSDGRTLFLSAKAYKLLKLSPEFLGVETLGRQALSKGEVGEYDNMPVVKVPSRRWPAHVNFLVVHKQAATAPVKLNDTRIHVDPPGLSGNLLEGRQYYDCFVFAPRADGVYTEVDTASGAGRVLPAPSISSAGAFSGSGSGVSYRYTTDGSDPRYSPGVKTGSSSDVTAADTVVRVFAYAGDGAFPSPVTTRVL